MDLLAAVQLWQSNPLDIYEPTAGCDPFHRDLSLNRLLRAPNQVGKTYAGCAEDWWFLLDLHPYRPRHGIAAPKLLVLIAQIEKNYREFCEKLHALEPPGILADGCRYIAGHGYTYRGSHVLVLKSGAMAVFAGGEGQSIGSAGGTFHALHVDEPPKAGHFDEAIRSVMHRGGPIWATMTPVGRPVGWFKLRVEGDPETGVAPRERWSQTVPELTLDAIRTVRRGILTREPATIQRQIDAYTGTEHEAQRLRGAWDGTQEGRRFPGFIPGKHVIDCTMALAGKNIDRIRLSVDYGERPDTLIAGLHVEVGGTFYVLAERPGRDNGLPASIAADMAAMCHEWGLPLAAFSRAAGDRASIHGDINSAGIAGGGMSANEMLTAALVSAGFPEDAEARPPAAGKGRGSVLSGEIAINATATTNRLYVDRRCKRVIHAMSYYVAGDQSIKHPIDMLRYGMGDRMIATMGRQHTTRAVMVL